MTLKENSEDRIFNTSLAFLTRLLLRPSPIFLDPSMKSGLLKEPCILVSNHTGHLDGAVLNTVFRKTFVHTLAAKDRFGQRGFGFFLKHSRCIPIDREHADTSWIHEALKVLKVSGHCVAIYPEGRHGQHRKQLPFHPGVTLLTALAGVPVVLVYIDGPFKFFHRSGLIVSVPEKLDIPEGPLTPEVIEGTTKLLEGKMEALMNEYIEMKK